MMATQREYIYNTVFSWSGHMIIYFMLLFVTIMAVIYSILLWTKVKNNVIKFLMVLLLSLALLKYITLYIFGIAQSPEHLFLFRFLFLASLISLPAASYGSLRLLRNAGLNIYDKILMVFMIISFSYILYNAPEGIISSDPGYTVLFREGWMYIILIIQCIFSVLMVYLSFNYFIKQHILKIKLTYFLYLIAYTALLSESLLQIFGYKLFPENIISEILIVIAIIAALKVRIISNTAN